MGYPTSWWIHYPGVGNRLSVDSLPDDLPEQGQCTHLFFDPKLRGFLMKNFPLANPELLCSPASNCVVDIAQVVAPFSTGQLVISHQLIIRPTNRQ